jgi:hypothetical protein
MALAPARSGDGAGDLEDAVVSAGREVELFHRLLEQAPQRGVDGAMLADLRVRHAGVRGPCACRQNGREGGLMTG